MVAESSKSFERTESGEALKRRPSADGAATLAADLTGKKELVEEGKLADKELKEGKRRSGVTDQIGKLHLTGLDDDRSAEAKGSKRSRDTDPGFIPTDAENARNAVSDFALRGPESTRNAISDFAPGGSAQVRDNGLKPGDAPTASQKDVPSLTPEQQKAAKETALELAARFFLAGTELEAVRKSLYGKTEAEFAAIDATFKDISGKGLEETFAADVQSREDGQLTEVKSTVWKRREVDGKEEWVNEKGTVWKWEFRVGADGNLAFQPHDGGAAFVFSPHGNGGFMTIDKEGHPRIVWKGGSVQVETDDHIGYFKFPDNRSFHWGPKPEDNYETTADGGIVRFDKAMTKRTTWENGVVKTEYPDGSGNIRTPEEGRAFPGEGGYSEHHWGPRPEQNYDLAKTADGRWAIMEQLGDALVDKTDANDPRVEMAKLDELAEGQITDPEMLARFQNDARDFEERAAMKALSKDEIAETYKQVGRLLDSPGEQPIAQADRIRLAQEVMHLAAHPTECDQGDHKTCNVTTVESRTYTRNPAAAAKLVADVATTGQFKTADGSIINIDANSLQKDFEAGKAIQEKDDRNYASQIFQVTAVNIHWQRQDKRPYDRPGVLTRIGMELGLTDGNEVAKGSIRYEQRPPVPGMTPPDTGERLVDYSRNPPQVVVDGQGTPVQRPNLYPDAITEISNQITGKNEKDMVIVNKALSANSAVNVGSEKDLQDALAKAKVEGRMPIIIYVHTSNEPFFSDSGEGAAGGSGGWHVVNITDYDAANALVSVDNEWGESADGLTGDRRVSTANLYKATSEKKAA